MNTDLDLLFKAMKLFMLWQRTLSLEKTNFRGKYNLKLKLKYLDKFLNQNINLFFQQKYESKLI
jgi:hypothetical protein